MTASPAAVLIQGFPQGEALEELRARLRAALRDRQLGRGLDIRYRLRTAHLTVVRFRRPLSDGYRFAEELSGYRVEPFGTFRVEALSLVKNDWYMSSKNLEILSRYQLMADDSKQA